MKLRHLLTGTILTVSLLAATAITALAAAPKGRFETVNSTTISGWAYNSSTPDDALNVRISVKDKNTGEEVFSQRMTAGEYSDKLYDSGKGNGCHAFTLNMDWSALPDGVYLVEGYVGDNDFSNPEPIPTATLTPNRKPLLPRPRTWFPWACSRQQGIARAGPAPRAGDAIPAPAQWPRPATPLPLTRG